MFLNKEQRRRRLWARILFVMQAAAVAYSTVAVFALLLWLGN